MKSGIELLEELIEEVRTLNKRFEITEQNVKLLLQKSNVQASEGKPMIMANDSPVKIKGVAPDPTSAAPKMPPQIPNDGMARVIGKIKDKDGRVVSGVNVKVYDVGNKMVKNTKTNRAGEWMCFLPKGVYYAKYQLKEQMPMKADFHVEEGQKFIRIAN